MESDGLKIGVFRIQTTPNQLQTDSIGIIRVVWTPIRSFLESKSESVNQRFQSQNDLKNVSRVQTLCFGIVSYSWSPNQTFQNPKEFEESFIEFWESEDSSSESKNSDSQSKNSDLESKYSYLEPYLILKILRSHFQFL